MIHDIRYGLRVLARSPAFTAIAALSLALGIGANTAIFSIVNAVLLKPLPVAEPARLASVFLNDQRNPGNLPLSDFNFRDLRDQNQVFDGMAAFTFAQVNRAAGSESEQIQAQVVTANYFAVLGVNPAMGRAFLPEEDRQAVPVVVLSHGFWERSLGSDPAIVGKTITLNRTPFTVVGVAPAGFTGVFLGRGPDVWLTAAMHDVVQPGFTFYNQRRGVFLFSFGRLKPGISVEQASANVAALFAQLEQAYPADNKGRSAGAVSLLDARLNPNGQGGGQIVQLSAILMIVVGIVLLIACANIANLLLARGATRRREIAIRLALGAKPSRLVRMLGLFGGLALLLASVGLYGVASYTVTQRTREIGVRMALGARPSTVLRLVLAQGFLLVAAGLVTGLVVALVLARFVPPALLPNVSARDPLTFAGTSILLATVAVIASYIPARRATRIDPLLALRAE